MTSWRSHVADMVALKPGTEGGNNGGKKGGSQSGTKGAGRHLIKENVPRLNVAMHIPTVVHPFEYIDLRRDDSTERPAQVLYLSPF